MMVSVLILTTAGSTCLAILENSEESWEEKESQLPVRWRNSRLIRIYRAVDNGANHNANGERGEN